MKNIRSYGVSIIFVLTILIHTVSEAQPSTWAQPGAHWYYSEGDNVPIGSFGYFEIWEDGDTLFSNGITCDILRTYREGIIFWFPGGPYSGPGPTWYTYQSNDTVYVYYNNQFNILFIDNQVPGEQFVTGPDLWGGCDGDTIIIDSLYSVTLSGITMNKIVPVVPNWWDGQWPPGGSSIVYHYPIYTRFGSTAFFTPAPNCITDVAIGPLRCYSDSSGFSFTTNVTPTCDYITSISEEVSIQAPFIISPNPVTDELTIYSRASKISQDDAFEIYNLSGSLVQTFDVIKNVQQLNVSNLAPGSYFIKSKNKPGSKAISFVKH